MELLKELVNSEKIGNTLFNLYDRWEDEKEYEDIKEYGNAIVNTIAKEYPTLNVTFLSATKRPFGVKFDTNKGAHYLWIKREGCYASLCGKKIV